jgi:hypothetical protein
VKGAAVSHRTRPLPCHLGLHRPSYVWHYQAGTWGGPDERTFRLRVCAACGVRLEGGYWDTAAATLLVLTPLLAAAAGYVAGQGLRTHRGRR